MSGDDIAKVTPARLRRDAYLYIRQSTLYQVINNTESTGRQYDLKSRAVGPASSSAWNAPGWPATPPTGSSSSRSAPTPTRSSSTKTAFMTRPSSTTGSFWE